MVHGALSEALPVAGSVLNLPDSGDVLVHLLLEATCPVLKYLLPKDVSLTTVLLEVGPTQSLSENVSVLLGRYYILYIDFPCPE